MDTVEEMDRRIEEHAARAREAARIVTGCSVEVALKHGGTRRGKVERMNPRRVLVRLASGSLVERRLGDLRRVSA